MPTSISRTHTHTHPNDKSLFGRIRGACARAGFVSRPVRFSMYRAHTHASAPHNSHSAKERARQQQSSRSTRFSVRARRFVRASHQPHRTVPTPARNAEAFSQTRDDLLVGRFNCRCSQRPPPPTPKTARTQTAGTSAFPSTTIISAHQSRPTTTATTTTTTAAAVEPAAAL